MPLNGIFRQSSPHRKLTAATRAPMKSRLEKIDRPTRYLPEQNRSAVLFAPPIAAPSMAAIGIVRCSDHLAFGPGQSQCLSLLRPIHRQVGQCREAVAARNCASDRCLYDVGSQEGERQDHANGSLASIFARRDRRKVGDVPLNQLIEPSSFDWLSRS